MSQNLRGKNHKNFKTFVHHPKKARHLSLPPLPLPLPHSPLHKVTRTTTPLPYPSSTMDKENAVNVMLTTSAITTTTTAAAADTKPDPTQVEAKRRFGWSPSKTAKTATTGTTTSGAVPEGSRGMVLVREKAEELFPAEFEAGIAESMVPKFSKDMRFNMKKKLDRLGEYFRALKRNMQETLEKKNELVAFAAGNEASLEAIRSELLSVQESAMAYKSQLHDKATALVQAQAEAASASAAHKAEAANAAQLGGELKVIKNLLREAEVLVTSQAAQLETAKQDLADANTALQTAQKEHELNVTELNAQAEAAAATAAAAAKEAAAEAQRVLDAAVAEKEAISAQKKEVESALAAKEAELAASAAQVASLTAQVAEGKAAVATLEGAKAALGAQLEANSKQLTEALASFNEAQAANKERTEALVAEKATLQANLDSVQKQMEALGAQLKDVQDDKAQVSAQLASTTTRAENAESALATLQAESSAQIGDLNTQVTSLTAQVEEASQALASSSAQVADLEAQLIESQAAGADAAAKVAELEESLAEIKANMEAVVKGKEEVEAQLAETTEALETTAVELKAFKACSGVSSEEQLQNLVQVIKERDALLESVKDRDELAAQLEEALARAAKLSALVHEGEAVRRTLHNRIQELRGTVRVVARVRPLLPSDGEESVSAGPAFAFGMDKLSLGVKETAHKFEFDQVFGMESSQAVVFDEVANFVQSALDGYAVNLFAYGQTGSGKTHTMSGSLTGESRGIIPRSVEHILGQVERLENDQGWTYTLRATFVEIYNENVRDLLREPGTDPAKIGIRHIEGTTQLLGAKLLPVATVGDVADLMEMAAGNRAVGSTSMNAQSSRSHSVFTLHLDGVNAESGEELKGVLNLCDLAGSERLAKSKATGERLKEAQAINKSLSSLSDVFIALSKNASHVPYRNSKLTYLLQNAFSAGGKSLMVVNLSPTLDSRAESICSLRFAAKVHNVDMGKPKKRVAHGKGAGGGARGKRRAGAPVGGDDVSPSKKQRNLRSAPTTTRK